MLTRNGLRWPTIAEVGTMGALIALIAVIVVAIVVFGLGSRTEGQLPGVRPEDAPSPAAARGPGATKPVSRPAIATTPISFLPPVTIPAPGPVATTPSAPVAAVK
jgi:hypothetical protein